MEQSDIEDQRQIFMFILLEVERVGRVLLSDQSKEELVDLFCEKLEKPEEKPNDNVEDSNQIPHQFNC